MPLERLNNVKYNKVNPEGKRCIMNTATEVNNEDIKVLDPEAGTNNVKDKIIHVLKVYPLISYSMLQNGIGPSLPPVIWRPVLAELIKDKVVQEEAIMAESPSGRQSSYRRLSLVDQTQVIKPLTVDS